MSQTDNAAVAAHLSHVRIVMVNTTLPANIGSALRAMKTMGLNKLVLVAPKTYPHPDIDALAAGATDLIEQIEVVEQLEDAIADCHLVFGTSARSRTIPWPLLDARPAAVKSLNAVAQYGQNIAIIFGREDRGLTNEELALANYHVTIPVNEEYGVLNVAQAIQVICYEMRIAAIELADKQEDLLPGNRAVCPLYALADRRPAASRGDPPCPGRARQGRTGREGRAGAGRQDQGRVCGREGRVRQGAGRRGRREAGRGPDQADARVRAAAAAPHRRGGPEPARPRGAGARTDGDYR